MEAGKRIITDIFNRARSLEIPFFQRAYVWSEENWERFLNDMLDVATNRQGYFLGSIILKQLDTSSSTRVGDVRAVVDGQQRLTTLLLFFKVLCDASDKQDFFATTFYNFADEVTLKHNHNDAAIFEAILEGRLDNKLKEEHRGNKVLEAYEYLKGRQAEIARIDPIAIIMNVYFVGIDLARDEDEQQIFDTINSLGVGLSTAELLKNELFGRADLALYEETWKAVFETDASSVEYWSRRVTSGRSRRENIDLFLQAFLVIQPHGPDDVRVENLFAEYKVYLRDNDVDTPTFVRDLTECANLYRENMDPDVLVREVDSENAVERLGILVFGLSTTTVVPFILYVLRHVESEAERHLMLSLVENYLLRRLVCRETTKNYNRFFTGLVRAGYRNHRELAERLREGQEGNPSIPDDERLRAGFETSNLTNQQARVILYLLECSTRDEKKHSTVLGGFDHYSLEHLMPKKWRNHWGKLPDDAARERDQALRKLGNLSILSARLNISVRDAAWRDKKKGQGKQHGLERYAGGLETLADALKQAEWDEARIADRGNRLADWALKVWPFE